MQGYLSLPCPRTDSTSKDLIKVTYHRLKGVYALGSPVTGNWSHQVERGLGQGGEVCLGVGDTQHWTVWKNETFWVRDSTPLWPWLCGLDHYGPLASVSFLSHEHLISEGLSEPGWKLAEAWMTVSLGPGNSLLSWLRVGTEAACSLFPGRAHLSGDTKCILGRKSFWKGRSSEGFKGGKVPSGSLTANPGDPQACKAQGRCFPGSLSLD